MSTSKSFNVKQSLQYCLIRSIFKENPSSARKTNINFFEFPGNYCGSELLSLLLLKSLPNLHDVNIPVLTTTPHSISICSINKYDFIIYSCISHHKNTVLTPSNIFNLIIQCIYNASILNFHFALHSFSISIPC